MKTARRRLFYVLALVVLLGLVGGTLVTTMTNFGRPDNTDFDPVVP